MQWCWGKRTGKYPLSDSAGYKCVIIFDTTNNYIRANYIYHTLFRKSLKVLVHLLAIAACGIVCDTSTALL